MARELRSSLRVPLELPVLVRWRTRTGKYRETKGTTGNISGNGLFLAIRPRLGRDTPIAFRLNLPTEITKVPVTLSGEGHIVRHSGPLEMTGVAAVIDSYELKGADA